MRVRRMLVRLPLKGKTAEERDGHKIIFRPLPPSLSLIRICLREFVRKGNKQPARRFSEGKKETQSESQKKRRRSCRQNPVLVSAGHSAVNPPNRYGCAASGHLRHHCSGCRLYLDSHPTHAD